MKTLRTIVNAYNTAEKWTLIAMMAAMVIAIFAQVFTRYVLGQALYWSEEFGKFVFVWASWLGCSAGMTKKEHIQVLLLPNALHKKGKYKSEKINYIIIDVLWFITSIIVAIYGFEIVGGQIETGVYGASTGIPMWLVYLGVPFSASLVCIRLLGEITMNIITIAKGSYEVPENTVEVSNA